MRVVLILALVSTFVTLSMCAVSIAIPYWLYMDSPRSGYQGLWIKCINYGSTVSQTSLSDCFLIKLPPEFLDATRVMMLFGLVFYLFAVICSFLYTFVKKEKLSLVTASIVFCIIGAMLCLIGVVVYGAKYPYLLDSRGMRLHAGFGLAVCSVIGGFVSTLFYCMSKARGEID